MRYVEAETTISYRYNTDYSASLGDTGFTFIIYLIGMVVLGTGLSLSTKLGLGTSALVALPLAISKIYNLNFGNITLIYYIVFIIIQIIIHIIMKKYPSIIGDISQIVISLLLTRFLNILDKIIPMFSEMNNVFRYTGVRIILYIIPITLIGVGAALIVKTIFPPNPPNGLIKTVSEFSKKDVGLIKNITDITLVTITVIFSYIACNKIIGVGIGTIMAMLGVGRVIYYFNKTIGKNYIKFKLTK